jgi:5'-nucleotidase
MVISGINDGANMGDDTIYSGTVAAAMEGFLLGIPSFAVSMSQHSATYFETAAKVIVEIVQQYQANPFPPPVLMNINVPDIPYEQLKGKVVTRLGKRHKAEPVIKLKSPRGETIYWVGPAGDAQDAGEGTDFYAVANHQVSLTPLQADLTHHSQLNALKDWMKK